MTKGRVTMSRREQQRARVLVQVIEGRVIVSEAARLLGLSPRHIKRLVARVRRDGPAALAHGNRGHSSPRRLPDTVRSRVLLLARSRYAGVNDHHLTDLLREHEGLRVSRPTVQRLLRNAGIGSPRTRRAPRHRRRRERMPQAGLLVQMDGSHHPWLEERGPRLVLLAAVDDATGELLAGIFRPVEDAHGYFLLLRQLIRRYGLPAAAYTDRHGIFHRDPRARQGLAEQLEGEIASTQIGRALQELGIRWIPASSPQGKGRVERLFGTLQDRLVVELRLAQASTLAEAQRVFERFRPRYNAHFTHAPAHPEPAWRPAPPNLARICCFKHRRTVAPDNTLQLGDRALQIHPGRGGRSYAGARVDVYAHLDGTLAVYYRGQRLRVTRLPRAHGRVWHFQPRPSVPVPASSDPVPRSKTHTPAPDHPWHRSVTGFRTKRFKNQPSDIFTEPLG
ncbi:MAG TPA: ISNCY family transposase [bacterium]|nr:ISNCY family transposase [bacterium]